MADEVKEYDESEIQQFVTFIKSRHPLLLEEYYRAEESRLQQLQRLINTPVQTPPENYSAAASSHSCSQPPTVPSHQPSHVTNIATVKSLSPLSPEIAREVEDPTSTSQALLPHFANPVPIPLTPPIAPISNDDGTEMEAETSSQVTVDDDYTSVSNVRPRRTESPTLDNLNKHFHAEDTSRAPTPPTLVPSTSTATEKPRGVPLVAIQDKANYRGCPHAPRSNRPHWTGRPSWTGRPRRNRRSGQSKVQQASVAHYQPVLTAEAFQRLPSALRSPEVSALAPHVPLQPVRASPDSPAPFSGIDMYQLLLVHDVQEIIAFFESVENTGPINAICQFPNVAMTLQRLYRASFANKYKLN